MRKSKLLTIVSVFGFLAFFNLVTSAQACENFAKSGAIKAYVSEMGSVQGSNGIEYNAKLVDNLQKIESTYLVDISDNNEDGDYWTVNYLVKLTKVDESGKCRVKKIQKIGVVI